MNKSRLLLVVALVLIALLAGGLYWWTRPEPIKTTGEAIEALSESPLENLAPASNPLQNKVPEVNPVDKTNPFKDIYKNPFAP